MLTNRTHVAEHLDCGLQVLALDDEHRPHRPRGAFDHRHTRQPQSAPAQRRSPQRGSPQKQPFGRCLLQARSVAGLRLALDTGHPIRRKTARAFDTLSHRRMVSFRRRILRESVKEGMERARAADRSATCDGATGVRGEVGAGGARDPGRPPLQEPGSAAVGRRLRDRPAAAAGGEGRGSIMNRRPRCPADLRISYHPETDALYLEFRPSGAIDNIDLAPGVTADIDRRGCVLGIEVLHASRHLRPFLAGLARRPSGQDRDQRAREFRRLWALLASRAKCAGITPKDVSREVAAHRAGRWVSRAPACYRAPRWLSLASRRTIAACRVRSTAARASRCTLRHHGTPRRNRAAASRSPGFGGSGHQSGSASCPRMSLESGCASRSSVPTVPTSEKRVPHAAPRRVYYTPEPAAPQGLPIGAVHGATHSCLLGATDDRPEIRIASLPCERLRCAP